jgi:hypothetical protein
MGIERHRVCVWLCVVVWLCVLCGFVFVCDCVRIERVRVCMYVHLYICISVCV